MRFDADMGGKRVGGIRGAAYVKQPAIHQAEVLIKEWVQLQTPPCWVGVGVAIHEI